MSPASDQTHRQVQIDGCRSVIHRHSSSASTWAARTSRAAWLTTKAGVLSSISVKTEADRGPVVGLDNLVAAGNQAVQESGLDWERIAAVGLGSPGTMDIEAGMLLDPPNLPGWDNLPIRQPALRPADKPVVLQNDGNAAAYGEYWVGAGKNTHSLVMFTLGTGVGGGIVIGGTILEGRHSHGGECGHIIIEAREWPAMFVRRLRASRGLCVGHGTGAARHRGSRGTRRSQHAAFDQAGRSQQPGDLGGGAAGDHLAQRLMRETAHYLAVGAVSLMHTIDPDIVALRRGHDRAPDLPFLEDIRGDIRSMAFPVPAARTRIEYAQLGGEAGFIGAAGCAQHQAIPRLGSIRTCERRGHLRVRFASHGKVLDLELDLAPVLPLVDRRVEDGRAARAGRERLSSFGHVPADGLSLDVSLLQSKLKMILSGLRPGLGGPATSRSLARKRGRGLPMP